MMGLAQKLSELAEKVEALEDQEQDFEALQQEVNYLRAENEWLIGLLTDYGITLDKSLSVADVMAIEKALQTALV